MAGMATVSIPQDLPLGAVGRGWTAADLELLPDDGRRYEIVDGVLVVSPAPRPIHQIVSAELHALLRAACPQYLRALAAPLDWQPDATRSFQPDLLVVPREDVTPERLTGTPMLVVEIVSPTTAQVDRTRKFDAYARAGVGQYWIVDPGSSGAAGEAREPSIEVYDLAESGSYEWQVRAAGDEQVTVAGPVSVTITPAELVA